MPRQLRHEVALFIPWLRCSSCAPTGFTSQVHQLGASSYSEAAPSVLLCLAGAPSPAASRAAPHRLSRARASTLPSPPPTLATPRCAPRAAHLGSFDQLVLPATLCPSRPYQHPPPCHHPAPLLPTPGQLRVYPHKIRVLRIIRQPTLPAAPLFYYANSITMPSFHHSSANLAQNLTQHPLAHMAHIFGLMDNQLY
jgi:hypothetical protein